MEEIGKWSELPRDLLDKIVKSLTLYGDYIRVRAVCVSWRSALPKTPIHLPHQFPLLMLPCHPTSDKRREFFSLAENKSYRVEFPIEVHGKVVCGSSHGWLVTLDYSLSVGLFNPFTKAHIKLPLLPSFVSDHGSEGLESVNKVVLSSNPSSSDFIAIAILKYSASLVFCRRRDNRWSLLKESPVQPYNLPSFNDIIFHKQQFVGVRTDGEVVIMDVIDSHGYSPPEFKIKQILRPPDSIPFHHNLFLVESDDEIFIVNSNNQYITTGFAIYKLEWSKNSKGLINAEWSEVKSLGDKMLFLGCGPSPYFSTRDFPGCKGNCIYFTNDLWSHHMEGHTGGVCVSVFDMEDKRIKPLPSYPRPQGYTWPPPIWVIPNPI